MVFDLEAHLISLMFQFWDCFCLVYFWVALYSLNLQEINVFLLKKNSRFAAGIPYLLAATPLACDKKTKEPN